MRTTMKRRRILTDMLRNARPNRSGVPRTRKLLQSSFLAACMWLTVTVFAAASAPGELLRKADDIKTVNYSEFVTILQALRRSSEDLKPADRDFLRYLEAWKNAYEGDDETAIARLNALADEPISPTLKLRAGATAVNVLQISKRYEEAFSRLSNVLELLPMVSDKAARQQTLLDAAELYAGVGQNALALSYAQTVIDEDWSGRGVCKGGRIKQFALYGSAGIKTVGQPLQDAIDSCVKVEEWGNANAVRLIEAMVFMDEGKVDDAIDVLRSHYDEVKNSRNPRMVSRFDALLAEAHRRKGALALAREYALDVTRSPVREFNEQLVTAFRVLYDIAKLQGDFKAALDFHEQYAAADKAYLDDVSAQHLAFQKVNHENIANKLQVDALNKQNHVLQLEKELTSKAVETSRLYIVLLTMTLLFIALWAYRTKRSQLHFQTLSRLDGLTAICNRPHFIALAEKALEGSRRSREHLCMILCDLDHFKQINDRYGHATGDFVLKRTVSACNDHLSKSDIFGRFGGEEFAILLPGCGPEEARQKAEQLRMAIVGITAYQTGNVRATVSASFGIAATSSSGHELGTLLAHADSALYEAKRSGRNRVVVYSPPTQPEAPSLAIVSNTGEFVQYTGRHSGAS
jgi:diguanylate cyclase (GGDEF)-like protein